ncbi:hypothetical protein RSOLAG22IIIB_06493 [Rhizoctonia solani]|uniref:F-box domain-containing protein n=1 Tax=Rhizoctonia solani TaxID=456999 RepID=A0A0K6GFD4_9AGAM|nr:hypothetical protein RSOLAG22IIIB_06493 [Rhizoctonia solani]
MNSTRGQFAYRYEAMYYLKYLSGGAQLSKFGQKLADSIPRDQSIFQKWVRDRARMLEEVKASLEKDQCPDGCVQDIAVGYELLYACGWTVVPWEYGWSYVIDLDNLIFTIRKFVHLRLDNMPPTSLSLEDWWKGSPNARFNIDERQQNYEALGPIILPVEKWGAPTWNDLTMAQQFSITQSNYFLQNMSFPMIHAYDAKFHPLIGHFCWDLLCAATSGVPLLHYDTKCDEQIVANRTRGNIPEIMVEKTGFPGRKLLGANDHGDHCWVRGSLVTFCMTLSQPELVAFEIGRIVDIMHEDGQAECVGIILSSQREIIFVAVDNGLEPTREVRHTPVLDIRPSTGQPGEASNGLLLLVHILSPPATIPPLPWRASQPPKRDLLPPRKFEQLPQEILQHIIHYADTETYLALRKVSRSIRKICVLNPRVGEYTILHKIPQGHLAFAARHMGDETLRILKLQWLRDHRSGHWEASEISSPAEAEDVVDDEASSRQIINQKRPCW